MSGISLTASMRSNLLSLQNIASQQDIVQNRLATGLKVSSAIDNPSSYYTASSLNNRAADLTALLDAMSQGIQTIKAASEAIASGTKFLEQAKAIANQALETAIPAKEWFAGQAGENGAVVETAQELLDAVNAGKETIVVYGKIDFMHNENITLQENQKLVGIGYFGDFDSVTDKFSVLNFSADKNMSAVILGNNTQISDLTVNYHNSQQNPTANFATLLISGNKKTIIENIEINYTSAKSLNSMAQAAILTSSGAESTIRGTVNIRTTGTQVFGIYGMNNAKNHIDGTINITTKGDMGIGIYTNYSSTTEVSGKINIQTSGIEGYGFVNAGSGHGNTTHILSDAEIYIDSLGFYISNPFSAAEPNTLIIDKGAKIALKDGQDETFLKTLGRYETSEKFDLTPENMLNNNLFAEYDGNWHTETIYAHIPSQPQYPQLLAQYDALISDAFYKGINLLTGQNLKINFNEDRSSKIDVTGVKADSESLGLKTKEWKTAEDIEKSVSELENAINSLRSFASAFGNYYSIVTTRQDFTENLINVLEEGADKLTLADMNQESANMLALQTSQQLAVNSLSLASEAAQSILRLF